MTVNIKISCNGEDAPRRGAFPSGGVLEFALEIPRAVLETSPEPPELPETDVRYFGDEDPSAKYFKYEKREDGSYKIVGLTYNGKQLTTLTIPLGFQDAVNVISLVTSVSKSYASPSTIQK